MAAALEAAHRAGIVHRDIKPANILLSSDGRVLVTDFGIAKAAEGADLTTDQAMLGTAKYLAPEQVEGGPVDGRADIYALGVVLYEMVCGRAPFDADTEAATALARLHRDPEPPSTVRPGVPAWLERTILRLPPARDPGRERPTPPPRCAAASRAADAGSAPARRPRWRLRRRRRHRRAAAAPAARPPEPVAAAPPAAEVRARPARRRRWPIVALLGAGAIVAAVLATGISLGSDDPAAEPITIASTQAFDPEGHPPATRTTRRRRSPPTATRATVWRTETYRDPAVLGKRGVGWSSSSTIRCASTRCGSPSAEHELDRVDLRHRAEPEPTGDWGDPVATAAGPRSPGRLVRPRRPPRRAPSSSGSPAWATTAGSSIAEVQASG